MWAGVADARRSSGNDRELERYLRTEYLGGTTLAWLETLNRFEACRPLPVSRPRGRGSPYPTPVSGVG